MTESETGAQFGIASIKSKVPKVFPDLTFVTQSPTLFRRPSLSGPMPMRTSGLESRDLAASCLKEGWPLSGSCGTSRLANAVPSEQSKYPTVLMQGEVGLPISA